jgi:hypothetical protein
LLQGVFGCVQELLWRGTKLTIPNTGPGLGNAGANGAEGKGTRIAANEMLPGRRMQEYVDGGQESKLFLINVHMFAVL